jgi:hypothetical protein
VSVLLARRMNEWDFIYLYCSHSFKHIQGYVSQQMLNLVCNNQWFLFCFEVWSHFLFDLALPVHTCEPNIIGLGEKNDGNMVPPNKG